MGGVAKAVSTVAQYSYDVAVNPLRSAAKGVEALRDGKSVGTALGATIKQSVKPALGVLKGAKDEIMGTPDQAAMPTPPAQESAGDKAAREEAARRKAKSDLAKEKPGRGQTILSDESAFPYRLV